MTLSVSEVLSFCRAVAITNSANDIYFKGACQWMSGNTFEKFLKEKIGIHGSVYFTKMATAGFPGPHGRDFITNCLNE